MTRRKSHSWLSRCCYHISNTCYDPARIFRYACRRQQAMTRLRELDKQCPFRVLNYLLHPNGYRLLVEADHPEQITEALRSFHVGTTHDFFRKHEWQGPVWRQRGVNVTLVEKGPWALRCALSMDFAMMHVGNPDQFHPLLWDHSGHREHVGIRKRYRLTNRSAIQHSLMDTSWEEFREWYIGASNALWNSGEARPEPWWENSLVVGSQELCEAIAETMPESRYKLNVYPSLRSVAGLQDQMAWTVETARKRKQQQIRKFFSAT